jgi:hypothetical protein
MTLDFGQAQLAAGLARWYRKYAKEQAPEDRARHEFEEQEARARRVGLWREPAPIPPWDWRGDSEPDNNPTLKCSTVESRIARKTCTISTHSITYRIDGCLDGYKNKTPRKALVY